MTREEKIKKRIERSKKRAVKNRERNQYRWSRNGRGGYGVDCPFDVDMNGMYGTCTCGGERWSDCAADI